MTFARPKIFDERLASFATTPSEGGGWAFLVFAAAAFAQLVVGYLIDRHSARTIFLLVTGLQAPLFLVAMNLAGRSEEHTSELQSLMRISYAVFCLKKKIQHPPAYQQSRLFTFTAHKYTNTNCKSSL